MQEIQTFSIPISWPNSALTVTWATRPTSSSDQMEWQRWLARLSLIISGNTLGYHLPLNQKGVPDVLDYKKIEGMPELNCSLAHSSGPAKSRSLAVGASLLSTNFMGPGVGIDVEWSQRKMRSEAYRRFRHEGDHASWGQSDNLLWTWMTKEAGFKAASNTWENEVTLINQIRLLHPFKIEGTAEVYDSNHHLLGDLTYRLIHVMCAQHALNLVIARFYF